MWLSETIYLVACAIQGEVDVEGGGAGHRQGQVGQSGHRVHPGRPQGGGGTLQHLIVTLTFQLLLYINIWTLKLNLVKTFPSQYDLVRGVQQCVRYLPHCRDESDGVAEDDDDRHVDATFWDENLALTN